MNNIYSDIQDLLNSIHKTEKTRWIADFNAICNEIEESIEHDDIYDAKDQVSLPPWLARLENGDIYLYSPPLTRSVRGGTFEAIRLRLNAEDPVHGTHVNARAVPVNENFEIAGNNHFSCIIINTNAEFIKESPLVAIWFLWDSIARVGIKKGLKTGLITETWVHNVFRHANKCAGAYPHKFYQRAGKANEYLNTLYRLCAARGITQDMLHGEGRRDGIGRYYNSWFNGNFCTCCNRSYRSPSCSYPNSFLAHVCTVKHEKNAAEFLLKMNMNEQIENGGFK